MHKRREHRVEEVLGVGEAVDERREVEQLADPGAGHAGTPVRNLGSVRIYVVVGRATPERTRGRAAAVASPAMEREVLSYCRICAAACGITVTVDGEQVVRVRGDAEHPVSRGYTCSKGRGLAEWHHGPDRLDRPRVRGARGRVGRGARRPRRGAARHDRRRPGADAVALYLATGMAYDSAGQIAAGTLLGSLGSQLVLLGGHRRQRAGAGGRRAGHRQRDAEPACGTRARPGCSCWSAPTRSCRTATAPRCPTR